MRRIACLTGACVAMLATSGSAETREQAAKQGALVAFLQSDLKPRTTADRETSAATATKLQIAWADLNNDGQDEALVYLSGAGWCGSGGCRLLILQSEGPGFRYRGRVTVTRPPVAILATRTHGWRGVTAYVVGGGIGPGYRAVLPFDGERYPSNPTVQPAYKLAPGTPETVVLANEIYPFL